ncbi:hypothetical protein GINT2_000870 [Glugoides intestinalis]
MILKFILAVSAKYIKSLTEDKFIVAYEDTGSLRMGHINNATTFTIKQAKEVTSYLQIPNGVGISTTANGAVNLYGTATPFQIVFVGDAYKFLTNDNKCLGYKKDELTLGGCNDSNFTTMFIFLDSKEGTKLVTRLKPINSEGKLKESKSVEVILNMREFSPKELTDLIKPFKEIQDQSKKDAPKDFIKINDF